MLNPFFKKNDKFAYWFIGIISTVVFCVVASLPRLPHLEFTAFNPHIFATVNAVINSIVSVLLIAAYVLVKNKKLEAHRAVMLCAIVLSSLFLVSYIAHHLFAGETKFGGTGMLKLFYLIILASHIILAAIILPIILLTAYQSLSGDYARHKKIARYAFPLWLYVAVTGVLVYVLISPYYT